MLIVLDTTEFFADLRMKGPAFELLADYVTSHAAQLFVPQIVIQEVENHFREAVRNSVTSLKNAASSVSRLIPEMALNINNDAIQHGLENYKGHVQAKLKELAATTPEYDAVEVKTLVERCLRRRKPFSVDGKTGFRDAIIWETVLNLLNTRDGELILISKNSTDFGQDGSLADDLKHDLAEHDIAEGRVTVCGGLKQFIERYVTPGLQKLDDIKRQIQEGKCEGFDADGFINDNEDAIRDALFNQLRQTDLEALLRVQPKDHRYHEPLVLNGPIMESFTVADVWHITHDKIKIGITYSTSVWLFCIRENRRDRPKFWESQDCEGQTQIDLLMTIVFDLKHHEASSWELNDIDITLGPEWSAPWEVRGFVFQDDFRPPER